jgi:hypothetical protein
MKYSEYWQNKLNDWNRAKQATTWETVKLSFPINHKEYAERHNLVILSEGIWMKITAANTGAVLIRKVRAITDNTIYYDGIYPDIYDAYCMRTFPSYCQIDNKKIHIEEYGGRKAQEKILNFIYKNSNVVNNTMPQIPKGIIKIPAVI